MAGRPSFRGRMGVEDGKHGEQDRDGMAVLGAGKSFGKATDTEPKDEGADSKRGGEGPHEGYEETTTAGYGGSGDGSPPNTVAMPIVGRGHAAPGVYGNTGHRLNLRGSLANTKQDSYNDRPGESAGPGPAKGKMMAVEPSNFYNELGGNKDDEDGKAESGMGFHGKRIEGFGGGKNTFGERSTFYNDDEGKGTDSEDNSGSGLIRNSKQGSAQKIKGFSNEAGLKSGMI